MARWLGLNRPDGLRDIQFETAPLDVLAADLLRIVIPPNRARTEWPHWNHGFPHRPLIVVVRMGSV